MAIIKTSRTLVIQPLPGPGDMLWYLPYLRALARHTSTGTITLLTKQKSQARELLKGESFIEEVLYLEEEKKSKTRSFRNLRNELKKRNFQTVWVLHHSTRYAFLTWATGIPERHGYGLKWQKLWLSGKYYLKAKFLEADPLTRIRSFVDLYGFKLEKGDEILTLPSTESFYILNRFKNFSFPWYVLGVGASQAFKRWSPDNFAILARKLAHHGTVFLLAGPSEKNINEFISSKIENTDCVVPISDLTVPQAAALISQAKCFIGNCSGPLNMAASLNIPAIGLFGATEILTYSENFIPISPELGKEGEKMDGISSNQVMAVLQKHELL